MKKRAHWDSKKEYEEFWDLSLKQRNQQMGRIGQISQRKRKRDRRGLGMILFLLFLLILVGYTGVQHLQANVFHSKNQITASKSVVDRDPSEIPEYSGQDVIYLNNNRPDFVEKDLSMVKGENYSALDFYGRCGTAVAMLDRSMMPKEEREGIGQVKPSGWNQAKYPGIIDSDPPYLFNRCHLIAYALTGQNANEKNLITGTRYMNAETMLTWEKQVMQYLDHSDNHVLYRVSPYFKNKELVARGVELEAYSVEDQGKGVCFHVFVYNVQPGIEINYSNGNSTEAAREE